MNDFKPLFTNKYGEAEDFLKYREETELPLSYDEKIKNIQDFIENNDISKQEAV